MTFPFKLLLCAAVFTPIFIGSSDVKAQQNVIDAKGMIVGTLVGSPDDPWIRRKMSDGTWTAMRVGYDGFTWNIDNIAFYVTTTKDCSGAQYMTTSLLNYGMIYTPYNTTKKLLRYPVAPFSKKIILARYSYDSSTGIWACRQYTTPQTKTVGNIKIIDTATFGYTPPFKIQ
mgnify:CR=1 FL=1